ncbi:MAG TPA: hypothetical protein VH063_18550 [Gaiellaceae bacterium]|jgi:hypothetical protein|nr:hypothetical protein [Gaiellaceae bacterium]
MDGAADGTAVRGGLRTRTHASAAPGLALLAGAVAFFAVGTIVPTALLAHHFSGLLPVLIAGGSFATVGCFVAYRQPQNPVGWLMLTLGVCCLVGLDAVVYSVLRFSKGYTGLPFGIVAVVVTPLEWVSVLLLLPLPLLLFPDGRLPPRWRRFMWCYLVVAAAFLASVVELDILGLLRPLKVDTSGSFAVVDHPPTGWLSFATNGLLVLVYAALALLSVARQVLAFRRSTGERRQQRKWLLASGAVCFAGLFAALATGSDPKGIAAVVSAVGLASVAALPVGFGIGILKYRLYDVDRIISRTISYTLVTGLLAAVFIGLVLLATRALPFSSPVGVAAATLGAASLFNPLRRRTQRVVDRQFNRARYDAHATATAFAGRLRNAVDPETISSELLGATSRTLEPVYASVWVKPDST